MKGSGQPSTGAGEGLGNRRLEKGAPESRPRSAPQSAQGAADQHCDKETHFLVRGFQSAPVRGQGTGPRESCRTAGERVPRPGRACLRARPSRSHQADSCATFTVWPGEGHSSRQPGPHSCGRPGHESWGQRGMHTAAGNPDLPHPPLRGSRLGSTAPLPLTGLVVHGQGRGPTDPDLWAARR